MNVTTIGAGNLGRGIGHRLVYQRADGVLPNICFQHLRHTCAMLPLTKGSYPVDSRAPLARHSHNVGLVLAVMSSIGERGAVVMEEKLPSFDLRSLCPAAQDVGMVLRYPVEATGHPPPLCEYIPCAPLIGGVLLSVNGSALAFAMCALIL